MSFNEFSLNENPEIYPDNIVSQGYSTNFLSYDNEANRTESLPTNATLEYSQDVSMFIVRCDGEELVSFLIEKEAKGSNGYMRFRREVVKALKRKENDLYKNQPAVSKLTSIAWKNAADCIKDKFRRNCKGRKEGDGRLTNSSQSFTCPDCHTTHDIPSQHVKLIYAETTTTTQSIKCADLKCQRKHKLVTTYKGMCLFSMLIIY